METQILILISFLMLVVAFLYSSVGHGGASGYLALMALFGFAPAVMKPSALLLNVFVSLIAFILFYKQKHFRWNLFWPFALASIPASFLGAMIPVDDVIYKRILGILLLFPIIRMIAFSKTEYTSQAEVKLIPALIIGGAIGILSGMIGIGGGIILSPLILLLKWGDMKQTAAVSAPFIFVNSISGLLGMGLDKINLDSNAYLWIMAALAGGMLGSYAGSTKINNVKLKYPLALVLVIACIKLLNI